MVEPASIASPERRTRSIDFLCEEERIRRLGERIRRDRNEGSELSRERRARGLARELRVHGIVGNPNLAQTNLTPISERAAIEASAVPVPSETAEPVPVPAAMPEVASAMPVPQWQPQPAVSLLKDPAGSAHLQPKDRLNNALEEITVKGIVDFRGIAEPKPEVEAVAVAALRLLGLKHTASADAESSAPAESWADVKRALLKPGHFVNALRRFPYVAERGQVPEDDICDVEEVLAEVPPHGQGLADLHPMAAHLYVWVRAALEYAAWSHTRLDAVASPVPMPQMRPASDAPVDLGEQRVATDTSENGMVFGALRQVTTTAEAWLFGAASSAGAPTVTAPAGGEDARAGFGVSWATSQAQAMELPSPEVRSPAALAVPSAAPAAPGTFGGPPLSASAAAPGTFGGPPLQGGYSVPTVRQHSPAASQVTRTSPARHVSPRPISGEAVVSATDTAPLRPGEVEEYQKNLEQTKREVREIRALEAEVKAGLERQEKQETEAAKKERDMEIMRWREEQAIGMRELAEAKARAQQAEDIEASKDFQYFKREQKQVAKEGELQVIKEQYQANMEFAQFQADIAKMAVVDRHALVLETVEDMQDLRENRAAELLHEKRIAEQEHAQEQRLRYAHQSNQLLSEKEELLHSLQLMRQAQKLPVTSNRGLASAGGRRR